MFRLPAFGEVVIKAGLGRSDFLVDPVALRTGLARNGWAELSVRTGHALEAAKTPFASFRSVRSHSGCTGPVGRLAAAHGRSCA